MLVADASAVLELLKASPQGERFRGILAEPSVQLHAPHLIDAEVLQAVRRWSLTGALRPAAGKEMLEVYAGLAIRRHTHAELLGRAWELRFNLSAYDALYVALAEGLDLPLLTADGRLASLTGQRAVVQLL